MNDQEIIENKNFPEPIKLFENEKITSPLRKNGYCLVNNSKLNSSLCYEDQYINSSKMKVFDMFPSKKDNFFCRKKAVTNILRTHSPNLTTISKSKRNIRYSSSSSIDRRQQSFNKPPSIISETDKLPNTGTYSEIPGIVKKKYTNDFN